MKQIPSNLKDFSKLVKDAGYKELLAVEVKENIFQVCIINPEQDKLFILYDRDLKKERYWTGTRRLKDLCKKLRVRNLQTRFNFIPEAPKVIKLSSGEVV